MRMSCNGCRVLRKGCSDSCTIRPCLQWIKSPEAQANATVFLAKFYGRAGLINLINAGPEHLRPAIFRSLLHEACGRIVNPIYGSVGLLWSGSWQLCQTAVESVLKGAPLTQISSESAIAAGVPGQKPYDIRHVAKNPGASSASDLHRVTAKSRACFKRYGSASLTPDAAARGKLPIAKADVVEFRPCSQRNDSDGESLYSVETLEGSHVSQGEPSARTQREAGQAAAEADEVGMGLDLTLGLEPAAPAGGCSQGDELRPMGSGARRVDLGLSFTA